jgi:two-component system chemotaxis sensor kinase CheA
MDELVADFISETSESLLQLDNELVELENNPENYDLLSKIFRVMHTIKGTCGFLGLNKLATVAHATESILDKMRSKTLPINSQNISLILEAIDIIKIIVEYIGKNGSESNDDYSNIINNINLSISGEVVEVTKPDVPSEVANNEEKHKEENVNQTVRVKVEVLDHLMQMISELVLSRNQLLRLERVIRNNEFSSVLQNLNSLTAILQDTIMDTRMQPIGNAWAKVPRIIRDLSKELNKKIKLVMIGQETELDKQLIEAIKDPLVHMVRNSADHGLEKEEDRIKAGKPPEGTITLKASYSNGCVIMEISDDGFGLNIAKIKSKILEKSLASESELASLSDEQIMQYIFKAGFSTAEKVTGLSGRGVGMDVVRNNIDNIRGSIEIKSSMGKGSRFIITIPLTLAIMPILVVGIGESRFGLAQTNILEMIGVNSQYRYKIEEMDRQLILHLRDSFLPLIDLRKILGLEEANLNQDYNVVVCESNGISFGLIVDNIFDAEEIVLKPLSVAVKKIPIYSGITLLGNGEIIMILSVNELVKEVASFTVDRKVDLFENQEQNDILSHFLVIKSGMEHKAIPLELVSRLEEIDVSKIEMVNGKKIIQHDNNLIYIEPIDERYNIPQKGKQLILIIDNGEHIIGIAVEKVIDIVKENINTQISLDENNNALAILAEKPTNIIDVNDFFERLFIESAKVVNELNAKYTILLLEDSAYFAKLFVTLIKAEGFVVIIENNLQAVKQVLMDKKIDLIIADFNMINDEKFDSEKIGVPLIALGEKMQNTKCKKVIAKANHAELIEAIYSLLESKNGE